MKYTRWLATQTCAIALSTVLVACNWSLPTQNEADVALPDTGVDQTEEEETEQTRLTSENISPKVYTVQNKGESPNAVVFQFSRSVVNLKDVGKALGEETRVRVVPAVDGTLKFNGTSSLKFTPKAGFLPGAEYTIELMAIQTRDGVVEAPAAGWSHKFKTPELNLVRVAPVALNAARNEAEVELVFSGSVKAADIKSRLDLGLSANGQRSNLTVRRVSAGKEANRVRVTLFAPSGLKGELQASVKAGYRSGLDSKMKGSAGEATVAIAMSRDAMTIESIHLVEGSNRFYIEVICDDDGNSRNTRWIWNRNIHQSFQVSPRCVLTEESVADSVHLSPEVPLSVSPSKGGFRLSGELKQGTYTITFDAGAQTVDGGSLLKAKSKELVVPALAKKVSFVSKGRYLPSGAWSHLPIQHRNTESVDLQIRHIPEENLVFWLSGHNEAADARTSNLIYNDSIEVNGLPDQLATSHIDVTQYVAEPKPGVYELKLRSGNASDTTRLLMTDINLVAKMPRALEGKPWGNEVKVWALDMHTGARQGNVFVDAIRPSGAIMGSCQTRSDGSCTISLPEEEVDQTPPMALIAKSGSDHTYLKFSELKTPTSEFRVGGEAFESSRKYSASIYGDRGVYRPGETAHVSVLMRNAFNQAPKTGLPVNLALFDPRSKKVREKTLKTNEVGLLTWDVGFSDYAKTGQYRVDVTVGKKVVSKLTFNVEEFVPERMEVTATTASKNYLDADPVPVDVDARYLFGGSAEGSRYELACRLEPMAFKPEAARQWTFGVKNPGKPQDLGLVSGTLKAEGKGTLSCPAPKDGMGFYSASRLVAKVSVYEAGSGRTSLASTSVPVHPEKYYVGLDTGAKKADPDKPFTVNGIVVDWDGNPVKSLEKVELRMYRMESEWGYVYDPDEGTERYRRFMREVPDGRVEVAVKDGKFSHSVQPGGGSNKYLVRAISGDTRTDLEMDGVWRYYWWDEETSADATPRPMKPGTVVMKTPEMIEVGESVDISFRAPYRGRALVSVETNQVLRSEWLDVEAGDVDWSFTLGEFNPNVYVSVLVVKDPHLDSAEAFIPDRAFGVESITVKPTEFTADMKLKAPESVRSNSKLKVEVDVGATGTTYLTMAAVDVGILSITGFQPPNPLTDVFNRRALGVDTFETIGWAMHMQAMGNSSSTGGDGDGADGGRVQMVKPVALWSGLVKADASGKATVEFDVPQYRGKLRVMAVSASKTRMGHASVDVVVKDPLVVQTTLPRFLTEGDQAEVPVFVTNMSGKPQEVTLEMDSKWLDTAGSSGAAPIAFTGAKSAKFMLGDGDSKTSVFRVRVKARTGAATLEVKASAGKIVAKESLDIPFESTGPRSRTTHLVQVKAGQTEFTDKLTGWVPGTERSSFWLTNNPYGRAFTHMSYLIRYPYGCIEQTTSSTRPLLFASSILGASEPDLVAPEKIDKMVWHGINRVLRMQTPSGGFSYWMGGDEANLWGTAYATHMLLDAQKAGYAVPQENVDDAVAFLDQTLGMGRELEDRYHSYSPGGAAYMHYVLARAGKGRKADILNTIESMGTATTGPEQERMYLLKAALYLAGDRRFESDLKSPNVSPLTNERRNSWSFYSDLRFRGFMLSIYSDLFGKPDDDKGAKLAMLVADGLAAKKRGHYYTTQELVWGVTSLGKIVQEGSKEVKGTLTVGGKTLKPDSSAAGNLIWNVNRASERGDVSLDTKSGDDLYVMMSTEGVRENAVWEYGTYGMAVTRVFKDANGKVIDFAKHKLGDMVYVELTVANLSRDKVQNVALVDRIPAGWEIENPRLGRGDRPSWVDSRSLWRLDHMNLRDDRIEAFGELPRSRAVKVVYAVRAVTAGTYTLPPVKVEAMYDPERWSRAPGREITISGPWAGSYL